MIKKSLAFAYVSIMLLVTSSMLSAQATSSWVFFGPDDRLSYQNDANGNRIMDYSYAGYGGGGVALPVVPAAVTVNPSGDDDTSNIQAAIDQVSALAPDANGFRGAVLLAPGSYNVSATLRIATSGVVLRGSGSGSDGTILNMTGPPFLLLSIKGSGSWQTVDSSAAMTDSYVPSGTTSFAVDDSSAFSVGDTILIKRPVTQAWVHFMDMDTLVRNGQPQTWLAVGSTINTDRVIAAINGNQITLDVPLTDNFDSNLLNPPGGSIVKYKFPGRISQVGLEHLSIVAPAQDVDISQPQYQALTMDAVIDGWVKDIAIQDTENSITLGGASKRITLDGVTVNHTIDFTFSAGPEDIGISGTQVFVNGSSVTGNLGVWPFVTQSRVTGPVVLLNCSADKRGFSPHQRWATGLLADGCQFPGGNSSTPGIAYSDRGTDGSGHGWDAGWAVAWNVVSPDFLVQEPPGVNNWCIGCIGSVLSKPAPGGSTVLPNGIYDSLGFPVTPASLYLEQLKERLGNAAIANIGYGDFALSVTPDSQAIMIGGSASYTVNATPSGIFSDGINLNADGLPTGVSASFVPNQVSGAAGSTMTLTSDGTTPAGTYIITIVGTSGNLSHSLKLTLAVNPSTDNGPGVGPALFTPPVISFITDPAEQQVVLNLSCDSIANVQSALDDARNSNPDAVIILRLSGACTVTDKALNLPSDTSLLLTGVLQAVPDSTAATLISIVGQSKVSVAGGTLDGGGADVNGIQVIDSGKVNIDQVKVRNTGREGVLFVGNGNTVWDSGSSITRVDVSASLSSGIRVQDATQVVLLDNNIHDNAGTGIDLAAVHSSIVNNTVSRNVTGVNVQSSDVAVTDNTLDANSIGLSLSNTSANNSCISNQITNSSTAALSLDGANNLVYANSFKGNISDIMEAGTSNFVVPDTAPLTIASNNYFYPPTIGNSHMNPIILNGRARTDMSIAGTTLSEVQNQYDSARSANPSDVIVLHLSGTFTHDAAPLTLSSNTAVILDGSINVAPSATGPVVAGSGLHFVSFSGGTIDCNSRVMEGINLSGSIVYLDHVRVQHCGVKEHRSVSNAIHLHNGGNYNIIRGSRVDVSGGRCIWTQQSNIRYIVIDNHLSNCQQDGIDFDSHTANSLAKGNLSENNTRYGIFIEEGAQTNKAYANTITGNGRGLNLYANVSGPTRRNTAFANKILGNSNGVRVGAINGNTTDENFIFDNVVQNNTGDGVLVQSAGTANYFSDNTVSANGKDLNIDSAGGPEFFNSPTLDSMTPNQLSSNFR